MNTTSKLLATPGKEQEVQQEFAVPDSDGSPDRKGKSEDIVNKILKLKELMDAGVLDGEEFKAAKRKLLG